MNNLVKGEFDKLTPFQQQKFYELSGWQTSHNKGQQQMSDTSLFKFIEWVRVMEEPKVEGEKECTDSPQK